MKRGRFALVSAALAAWLFVPASAAAHRLDEYLQATRIAIERDRIEIEIDLVPGVAVASEILGGIDGDHDGRLSSDEADAYARRVMASVALEIDGRSPTLTLTECRVSTWDEIRDGVGAIRLGMQARGTPRWAGRHSLVFRNVHRPEIGVYLVNLLVPKTSDLRVTAQKRDVFQRELRVDYQIEPTWWGPRSFWGLIAFATLLAPLVWRAGPRRGSARRPALQPM